MSAAIVDGCTLHELPEYLDARGRLLPLAWPEQVPFAPARLFLVRDVPAGARRGGHAHRTVHQFLVCAQGACTILVDDGSARRELRLDTPRRGAHLAPLVWSEQFDFSPDAVLLVLASGPYDPEEYLRDLVELRAQRRR